MKFQHELYRDDVEIPVAVTCRTYYDATARGSLGCGPGIYVEDIVAKRLDTGAEIDTTEDEDDVIKGIAVSIAES